MKKELRKDIEKNTERNEQEKTIREKKLPQLISEYYVFQFPDFIFIY